MAGPIEKLLELKREQIESALAPLTLVSGPYRGGQKVVYECQLDRALWALKLIAAEPESVPEIYSSLDDYVAVIRARLGRELDTMREIDVPQLVQMGPQPPREVEIEGTKVLYFLEEWISGTTVAQALRDNGPLDTVDVAQMGSDIASALWEMAIRNKVHRDVKPSNIMKRDSNKSFVLLDLGYTLDLSADSLTKEGWLVGTRPWFAPEQWDVTGKRALGFRSDQFSLGVVMYESITGQHPFWTKDQNVHELMESICNHRPLPPSTMTKTTVNQVLEEVIMRMISKEPHRRFPDAAMLIRVLESIPDNER